MTQTHTPGPYKHVLHRDRHAILAGQAIIATGYRIGLDRDCPDNAATFDLFAAAPALLEACWGAAAYYEMLEQATGVEHGVLASLRAAIAKATKTD